MRWWWLCCPGRRRRERRKALLTQQLERIKIVYPGTAYTCMLDAQGDVLVQVVDQAPPGFAPVNAHELAGVLTTLRRSIALFAGTLNQNEAQTIHIKGENHIFSCYGMDNHVLAFYTVMASVELEKFDCTDADKQIEPICNELQRLANADFV